MPETLLSGIQSGLRYTRHSKPLRALIMRNFSFSFCASALWALMPLVARDQLGLGAGGYGTLMASFGAGAIVGALAIPQQMSRRSLNSIVTSGVVLWAVAATLVAVTALLALAIVGAAAAGAAWVTVLSSLAAGTQSVGARVGARTRRRDQPRDQPGEPRVRQHPLGVRGLAFRHADRARRVRSSRWRCCSRSTGASASRSPTRRTSRRARTLPDLAIPDDARARRRAGADPDRIPDRAARIARRS